MHQGPVDALFTACGRRAGSLSGKINSKEQPEKVEQYIKKHFKADSLAGLSNDELEKAYRYAATVKRDKKKREG